MSSSTASASSRRCPSTLFREQSTTSTRDGDDDDVNDVGTADEKQRRERLQYPDDSDDDDGAEIEVRSPHPRAQVATDEYEAQVRSHHRAYAERTAARAANSPLEAGYGVSGGVSPAPNTPPTNRLVNPKYLVSPEEADAAGYGVTPAVAPNQPDADAVEYFDPTKHYVDYNDDDDDNNVPESPRKQKGGNSRLVSVQPDVPLDSGTLRAADIKAGKPSSRNTGIQRRPVVGSLRQHGSTSSMSSAIAATPTPTSSGSSSRSARAVASTSSESTTNVTIAAVTGHKMQPHVTTMQYKGDDLVHVERYRDGKLVTGGEVVKKKDKKAAAAMPTVTVSVRNASSSSSKSASAMVPLEGSNSTPLRSCKCPNCFQKNKYQPGTERLMCYSCRTTFRVPK